MSGKGSVFSQDTFRFFRELGRNNHKPWMDANRERYRATIVEPFRELLDRLTPAARKLNPRFAVGGRVGENFSRINRDIRFAKDKTPYRTQMYVKFCVPLPSDGETGQLYTGISAETVTAGFRIYSGSKRKESALGVIAEPRLHANPRWPAQQKKCLARRYESYWYSMVKGQWTKHSGWPITPEEWKKLQGWIVRRKLGIAAASKPQFPSDLAKIFRDLYPLLRFTSLR
jgi:uncharacterized protein (TIGR02453 family)